MTVWTVCYDAVERSWRPRRHLVRKLCVTDGSKVKYENRQKHKLLTMCGGWFWGIGNGVCHINKVELYYVEPG